MRSSVLENAKQLGSVPVSLHLKVSVSLCGVVIEVAFPVKLHICWSVKFIIDALAAQTAYKPGPSNG